ncbi:hypothetical protein DU504_11720 [Haloplanus salinus]|uniref:Uncharacterized protein n=1 Tax=Haloplanus salinus TaxID=1126245 RepID=A0A368NCQ0_9EURY|nr:hypothetical protein DU504_11720 [Haloplanus salinus]
MFAKFFFVGVHFPTELAHYIQTSLVVGFVSNIFGRLSLGVNVACAESLGNRVFSPVRLVGAIENVKVESSGEYPFATERAYFVRPKFSLCHLLAIYEL